MKGLCHIFICGLARSGTTKMLIDVSSDNRWGTLRYSSMPFILWPRLAAITEELNLGPELVSKRDHGDDIDISISSPESLDEPFWKIVRESAWFNEDEYNEKTSTLYLRFLDSHAIARKKRGMVIKNNHNLFRLESLVEASRNNIFVIMVRNPYEQSKSLLSTHMKISSLEDEEEFAGEYLDLLGHVDFGRGLDTSRFASEDKSLEIEESFTMKFWLEAWLISYRRILESGIVLRSGVVTVCYEDICTDCEYRKRVEAKIGCRWKEAKEWRLSDRLKDNSDQRCEGNSYEVMEQCFQIYDQLRLLSIKHLC